jgi:hypothetical protein
MSDLKDTIMVQIKDSSTIKAIGYVEPTSTLIVEFHSGGTYVVDGVGLDTHDKFMQADSKGQFYHKHIRSSGKYVITKLPNPAHRECAAVNPLAATS